MKTVTDKFGYRTSVTDEGTTKRGWASKYLREGYNAKLQKTREVGTGGLTVHAFPRKPFTTWPMETAT